MEEIEKRLKSIKKENYIWIIYIGIIILSYYSNSLEKDYFINNNKKSKDEYRDIIILIFSILLSIYIYFLNDSYNDLKNINKYSEEKRKKVLLSFISSFLIFISGVIFLYLAYIDENLDIELAFN